MSPLASPATISSVRAVFGTGTEISGASMAGKR
jgi:hypothetical protein